MKKFIKLLLAASLVVAFTGCDSEKTKESIANTIDSAKQFGEDVYNKTSFKTDADKRNSATSAQEYQDIQNARRKYQIMRSHNAPNKHMRQAY